MSKYLKVINQAYKQLKIYSVIDLDQHTLLKTRGARFTFGTPGFLAFCAGFSGSG